MNAAPQIGFGLVRHARLAPVRHAFAYRVFFLRLPMRALRRDPALGAALPRNRRGLVSFHDGDHGDGGGDALAWLDALLATHGIHDATGEAWLQCFPRVLGRGFRPVSFWYCHRADGSLRAIVAEVNNTFGERHCYLLDGAAWGRELQAAKAFHVSPFCRVEGRYRFRFLLGAAGTRSVARIDLDGADGALLQTSVSGTLEPLTRASLLRALLRLPLPGAGTVLRIHWQALRLWLGRVPVHDRVPATAALQVTR